MTLALNMMSQGIDPGLDLSDLQSVIETVHRLTDNPVHPRHPYAGELVFTAFSGSHQDAINKGMAAVGDDVWEVPYLTIDPRDVGRTFEAIIRVNSQSGKGGVAWVLRLEHGLELPKAMQPEFARVVQKIAETTGQEVKPAAIWDAFRTEYLDRATPYELLDAETTPSGTGVSLKAHLRVGGIEKTLTAEGNGPIEASSASSTTRAPPPSSSSPSASTPSAPAPTPARRPTWHCGGERRSGSASASMRTPPSRR